MKKEYLIKALMREIQILQEVKSENIILCKDVIESGTSIYFIQ